MTVIGRLDDGDSRWYIDPISGEQFQSVTSALSRTNAKPWLAPWSAKLAAETAVEHHDLITQLVNAEGPGPAIAWLKDAAKRRRELKAEIGSYQHDVIEALILDTPIPTPPEHLIGVEVDGETIDLDAITDGFLQFVEDFQPIFELAEATVANQTYGFAGTLDFVARFPTLRGRRGGIDSKTGLILEPTMNAQLAAYRNTEEIWLNDLGDRASMMPWDFAAVLHIRTSYKRGYKLLEQPADDRAFAWFLECLSVLKSAEAAPKVTGRPLYPARPDGSQPPMLLEDVEAEGVGRCVGPLSAVGVEDVADLASLTVTEALEVPGVGEKSIPLLIDALAVHGLTFTGPAPCDGGTADTTRRDGRKLVADCPTCGQQVPSAKTGVVRFHVSPLPVAA